MKFRILYTILLFLSTATACYYPSLKSVITYNDPLIVAEIQELKDIENGKTILKLKNFKNINGNSKPIKSISIESNSINLTIYDKIIFSPISLCSDENHLYDLQEIWLIKDEVIFGKIQNGIKKETVRNVYLFIPSWKKEGKCLDC